MGALICAAAAESGRRAGSASVARDVDRSSTRYTSANNRLKPRTGPCPVTGRATWSPGRATPTSGHWSNGPAGTRQWSSSRTRTPTAASQGLAHASMTCSSSSSDRCLRPHRGLVMAKHKRLKVDTGVKVHFCDPKSPWQRVTNARHQRRFAPEPPAHNELKGPWPIPARLQRRPAQRPPSQDPRIHDTLSQP